MAPIGEGIFTQLARGEPVVMANALAIAFGTVGAALVDGWAKYACFGLSAFFGALAARKFTTPQANPAPATRTAHVDQGGELVKADVSAVKPVITFRGRRGV